MASSATASNERTHRSLLFRVLVITTIGGSILWVYCKFGYSWYRTTTVSVFAAGGDFVIYWGGDWNLRDACLEWLLPWPQYEDDEYYFGGVGAQGTGGRGPRLYPDGILHTGLATRRDDKWIASFFEPGFWESDNVGIGWPRFRANLKAGSLFLPTAWFPVGLLVLSTAALARRLWRGKPGFCARCGYNLTGLKHERYPECGTLVKNAQRERA